mmetsp:Transcript_7690/g.17716  ORF Transcript_7690/g.17716 Transcript_7690/m.17716 type:complete len:226 (+) Transcript_7690:2186-2863(+)
MAHRLSLSDSCIPSSARFSGFAKIRTDLDEGFKIDGDSSSLDSSLLKAGIDKSESVVSVKNEGEVVEAVGLHDTDPSSFFHRKADWRASLTYSVSNPWSEIPPTAATVVAAQTPSFAESFSSGFISRGVSAGEATLIEKPSSGVFVISPSANELVVGVSGGASVSCSIDLAVSSSPSGATSVGVAGRSEATGTPGVAGWSIPSSAVVLLKKLFVTDWAVFVSDKF